MVEESSQPDASVAAVVLAFAYLVPHRSMGEFTDNKKADHIVGFFVGNSIHYCLVERLLYRLLASQSVGRLRP